MADTETADDIAGKVPNRPVVVFSEIPLDDWQPTHRLSDNEVDVVVGATMQPPQYRDRLGRVYALKPGRKAIKIPREDTYSAKVQTVEDAYQEGIYRGLRLAGIKDPDELDRIVLENGTEAGRVGKKSRIFPTRYLAAAYFAILGAHSHTGLCLDGQNCEGEYRGRDAEGNYLVTARIYDWQEKCHYIYQVKIPRNTLLEIVEREVVPNG